MKKTKICSKCKEKKDIDQFYKYLINVENSWCKKCCKNNFNEYYHKDRERIKKYNNDFRGDINE